MVRRVTENRSDTPLNIRIPAVLKIEVDKAADSENVSTAEWVRKVLQEKIDNMRAQNEAEVSACAAVPAGMEYQLRQIVWSCLNEAGLPYKKDGAAAADKERSEK